MYLAMGIVLALNISHFWQDTIWVGNCQECNMETKALFSFHLDPMAFSFPFSCFPNPTLAPKTFFMLKLFVASLSHQIFWGVEGGDLQGIRG